MSRPASKAFLAALAKSRTVPLFHDDGAAGAELSECGRYRYRLWRAWQPSAPRMLWVMLNPSTADASADDPTIRKCIGFARRHGYGSIEVVNLFAWRATDPRELRTAPDPVGPGNDGHVMEAIHRASIVVFGWGGFRWDLVRFRADAVTHLARGHAGKTPRAFGVTDDGAPRHPLMLAYSTPLEDFTT